MGFKMSSLVQALQQADQIEQMLIESNGLVTDEISTLMTINPEMISQLVDVKYTSIERAEMSLEFFKNKALAFQKIADGMQNYIDYTKSQIKNYMIESGKRELYGDDYSFKLAGAAPKLRIVDEAKLSADYFVHQDPKIDNKKIIADLKSGKQVVGCVLEENYSLRKSINKGSK